MLPSINLSNFGMVKVGSKLIITIHHECSCRIIRIWDECEGGIEKSIPRITIWHHKACRVMTNSDREGRIFTCIALAKRRSSSESTPSVRPATLLGA